MIQTAVTAFYCHTCGRMEGDSQTCPECGARRQHVSRYEWFLADALEDRLKACGLAFTLTEQFPITDPRSFTWYFDLRVTVRGRQPLTDLIEVNGSSHLRPTSRDKEKYRAWWRWRIEQDEPPGELWIVANDECRKAVVHETAARITASLLRRSGL